MQCMSRQIRLLRETVAFSSDAAAGIAGLPERRLRRPRRRHRPARREDVPPEGATQARTRCNSTAMSFDQSEMRIPMTTATAEPTTTRAVRAALLLELTDPGERMAHCHIASPPRERHAVRFHGRGRVWEATPLVIPPMGILLP